MFDARDARARRRGPAPGPTPAIALDAQVAHRCVEVVDRRSRSACMPCPRSAIACGDVRPSAGWVSAMNVLPAGIFAIAAARRPPCRDSATGRSRSPAHFAGGASADRSSSPRRGRAAGRRERALLRRVVVRRAVRRLRDSGRNDCGRVLDEQRRDAVRVRTLHASRRSCPGLMPGRGPDVSMPAAASRAHVFSMLSTPQARPT